MGACMYYAGACMHRGWMHAAPQAAAACLELGLTSATDSPCEVPRSTQMEPLGMVISSGVSRGRHALQLLQHAGVRHALHGTQSARAVALAVALAARARAMARKRTLRDICL